MKKIYLSLISIFIFPLVFVFWGSTSYAYTGLSVVQDFVDEQGLSIYMSDDFYIALNTHWQSNPNYNAAIIKKNSTTLIVLLGNGLTYNGNYLNIPQAGYWWLECPYGGTYYDSGFQNESYYVNMPYSNYIVINGYENANDSIDYENPIYSSAIPVPDMTVTFVGVGLSLPSNVNGVYVDCIVPQEDAFYIQLQAKYSVCDLVQINLNNGVISYDYLDWTDGSNFDIYGLQDNVSSVHVTAADFQTSWNTLINGLLENSSFPQFTSNVPFWVQNPSAQKYLDAQSRYKNVLMRQAPLYGSRMELFARYYAIVDDSVYVGKWVHWNSANPSNTEELGNKYQQDQPFPGFQNTSSDNNLPEQEDTYTNFGENTSVDNNPYSQVIINNNVPNYPDYPTAVSYNHDNILVQFITTAKQLPSFFGDFGSFLTTSFAFIPSYIWAVIGFGFMCSIVVMIIKVL